MSVVVYSAEVVADEAGGLVGRFHDFDGVEVAANSAADLLRVARERLILELQRLEERGEVWPQPAALGAPPSQTGASVILIDVSVDDTPIRLNISLGERLLRRIDQDADARSMTRSGYLALGARRLLGDAVEPPGGIGGETGRLQEEIAALGRRVNQALGPNSPVGRTLAELDSMALDGLRRLGGEVRSAMKARPGSSAPPTTSASGETSETDRAAPGAPGPSER